jgi:hypothetical protein
MADPALGIQGEPNDRTRTNTNTTSSAEKESPEDLA